MAVVFGAMTPEEEPLSTVTVTAATAPAVDPAVDLAVDLAVDPAADLTTTDPAADPATDPEVGEQGAGGRGNRPWRSIMLAPVGDGQTRRRGSDIVRVIVSVVVLLLCLVIVRANSHAEHAVFSVLTSPPDGVRWLVTAVWWIGSVGVVLALVAVTLLSRRWSAVRDVLVSGSGAWLIGLGISALVGVNGDRPPDSAFHGVTLAFPIARVAATVAVAAAALPYLSRWFQRSIETMIVLLALSAVVHGSGTPVAVVASVVLGWGAAAAVHLVFGSPLGLPSPDEVAVLLADVQLQVDGIVRCDRQEWGVARYTGTVDGRPVDVSVYGRDASDAQLMGKTLRFLFYRDSGPTLTLTRRQQVEHEAYLALMAESAGIRVPEVLAAGPAGPAHDAVLVTRPPDGYALAAYTPATVALAEETAEEVSPAMAAELGEPAAASTGVDGAEVEAGDGAGDEVGDEVGDGVGDEVGDGDGGVAPGGAVVDDGSGTAGHQGSDGTTPGPEQAPGPEAVAEADPDGNPLDDASLDSLFGQIGRMRAARISHGALSTQTIVVGGDGVVGLLDFRAATTAASVEQLDRDVAAALAASAVVVGAERTVGAATRSLPPAALAAALPFLQRAALDKAAARTLRGKKALLNDLREQGAASIDVEVPKLAEPRRVSWMTLLLAVGTLIGGWALLGVLINVTKSWSTITGAEWGWVAVVFVLAQAAYPAIAVTTVGSVVNPLPYGRTVALEVANTFVALAGGSMAVLAARVRFFQKEGYAPTLAISSGVLVSTASWIVKGGLFLIALPFALGNLHFSEATSTSNGNHAHLVQLVILVVLGVAVLLGVVLAVPRLRRLAKDKLRPKLSEMMAHLKVLATHPRNLVEIFGGNIAAQLFIAMALGAALHAFGDHLGLATLIVVLTLGSMLGGISPVPGGMGVVEAGMILGLQAAGISQTDAVAAVFVQRLFTAYLPPIWGWFVMVWMRKKEYI